MTDLNPGSGLDAAFERLASAGFELPNGFVNHGPMACEALDALEVDVDLEAWAGRFSHVRHGVDVVPTVDRRDFDDLGFLGDYRRLPEWIGFFEVSMGVDGWETVVATWVPRLIPAFAAKLFHGAIRTAHATRAVSESDTTPRRAELARALGYWAARFDPGRPAPVVEERDAMSALLGVGVAAACRYVDDPNIFTLHGVTGAMAAALLAPHLAETSGLELLARVRTDHDHFYGVEASPPVERSTELDWRAVAVAASASRDAHQVKLVEACRRGTMATDDPAFARAAELVTASP